MLLPALLGAIVLCPAIAAQEAPLFHPVPDLGEKADPAAGIARSRYVYVDPAAIFSLDGSDKAGPFTLPLFDGLDVAIEPVVIERGAESLRLQGRTVAPAGGDTQLVWSGGALAGVVRFDDAPPIDIRPRGGGVHEIRQFAAVALASCTAVPPALPGVKFASRPKANTAAVVDVLVLYTPDVAAIYGGAAGIEAHAALLADLSNAAYANSEVPHRIRLAAALEIDYAASGRFDTDLDRLTAPSDGILDEAHALRAESGADIVVLLVEHGDLAGLAWVLQDVESNFGAFGFAVVHQEYAASHLVFTHELGHLMGCGHERAPGGTVGAFPYAHAYVRPSHRTIMASVSNGGTVPYFSNPNLLYEGEPLGVPPGQPNAADNARTLRAAMPAAAEFRTPPFRAVPALIEAPVTSGDAAFDIVSDLPGDVAWTAEIVTGGAWLTFLSPSAGVNGGSVRIGHGPNDRPFGRTARIRITPNGGHAPAEVLIVQAADCGFIDGPPEVTAGDGAHTDRIRVSWTAVANADAYRVYRSRSADPDGAVAVSGWLGGTLVFDDLTAQALIQPIPGCDFRAERSPRYYYWVKARNACGESGFGAPDTGFVALPQEALVFGGHALTLLFAWAGARIICRPRRLSPERSR